MHKIIVALSVIFFMSIFIPNVSIAQPTSQSDIINDAVYDKILIEKFEAYSTVEISTASLISQLTTSSEITLDWFDEPITFSVDEVSIKAEDYQIRSAKGIEVAGAIYAYHMFGESQSQGGSITVMNGFIYGIIVHGDIRYQIEPLRYYVVGASRDEFIIYRAEDIDFEPGICGVSALGNEVPNVDAPYRKVDQCKVLEMAIASDLSMFQKYGSIIDVEAHNIAVVNNVQYNYRHEFDDNVEMVIVTQYVQTSLPEPWTSSTNAQELLDAFRDWGNNDGFGVGVTFDNAEFWTDRDIAGSSNSVIGLAYLSNAICGAFRYHILEDFTTNPDGLRVLTAHELGHNFGSGHDAAGSNYIMAPSVTITNNWSVNSNSSISSTIASSSCMGDCATEIGPPLVQFESETRTICVGQSINYYDKSPNGATRTWEFEGGTPLMSNQARPVVVYNTPGVYAVQLTSTNSAGVAVRSFDDYVVVGGNTAASCIPSGTAGGGGIRFFELEGISSDSENAAVSGVYEDFSCVELTDLQPNTTYDVTISLGSCNSGSMPSVFEQMAIFIDYNNDGSFEPSELVTQSNSIWCGTITPANDLGLRFTTASAPVLDEIIRMRVIADSPPTSDPCLMLQTGQAEDYGVVFTSQNFPIELLSFDVKLRKGLAHIQWLTATESNSAYFEIQRLDNTSEAWTTIGRTNASGFSSEEKNYAYTDRLNDLYGNIHYRLKVIDLDGSYEFTEVRSINVERENNIGIAYNNLNSNTILVQKPNGQTTIRLLDIEGQLVKQWQLSSEGDHALDIDGLTQGIYIITAQTTQGISSFLKIVKL